MVETTSDNLHEREIPACPHCNQPMKKLKTPGMTNWEAPFIWVCFNDECSYFQNGWTWMLTKFQVNSSYRYKLDPVTGEKGPLPVWSTDALKSSIIEDHEVQDGE